MKQLNDKELSKIRELELDDELARAKIIIEEQRLQVLLLKQRLLSLDIASKQNDVVAAKGLSTEKIEQRRSFLKLLQKKHKLKDGWGFNPDNGELKEAQDGN